MNVLLSIFDCERALTAVPGKPLALCELFDTDTRADFRNTLEMFGLPAADPVELFAEEFAEYVKETRLGTYVFTKNIGSGAVAALRVSAVLTDRVTSVVASLESFGVMDI